MKYFCIFLQGAFSQEIPMPRDTKTAVHLASGFLEIFFTNPTVCLPGINALILLN